MKTNTGKYLAIISPWRWVNFYAVDGTESGAERKAQEKVLEWLIENDIHAGPSQPYETIEDVKKYLECMVHELDSDGIAMEDQR